MIRLFCSRRIEMDEAALMTESSNLKILSAHAIDGLLRLFVFILSVKNITAEL
jgi:hypothetical protein